MIDGNIIEFIDKLYYGEELVFSFEGKKYFLQGFYKGNSHTAVMQLDAVDAEPFSDFIWEYHADNMRVCAEAFLSATIWDGKDFLQIQENVTWSDW